jgi:hypothetical protein
MAIYRLTCTGTATNWEIYITDQGHEGCVPEPDQIVECLARSEDCRGIPDGYICEGLIEWVLNWRSC